MHPILSENHRWQAHQAKVAEFEERHEKWMEKMAATAEKHEEAARWWRRKVEETRLAGEDPPPPPTPPPPNDQAQGFLQERQALHAAERLLLGEIGPAIEQAADARGAELAQGIALALAPLRSAAVEYEALLAVLAQVRAQTSQNLAVSSRPRTRPSLSLPDLVALIEAGESPLTPVPRGVGPRR